MEVTNDEEVKINHVRLGSGETEIKYHLQYVTERYGDWTEVLRLKSERQGDISV